MASWLTWTARSPLSRKGPIQTRPYLAIHDRVGSVRGQIRLIAQRKGSQLGTAPEPSHAVVCEALRSNSQKGSLPKDLQFCSVPSASTVAECWK